MPLFSAALPDLVPLPLGDVLDTGVLVPFVIVVMNVNLPLKLVDDNRLLAGGEPDMIVEAL